MEVATSVIAVVDVSVKVITLCSQYSKAVAGAVGDISRLETLVKGLKTTLNNAKALIESPEGASLSASQDLEDQLKQCKLTLEKLSNQLETAARKTKRRPWLRSLKWPFSREETEANISNLERCHRQIMDGLQIDQTTLLVHIKKGVDNITEKDVNTAQRPHFFVSFPRDPDFIARPAIQTEIHKQLEGTASRIALIGMGGFGKSQIAIEIAHSTHSSSPEKSVFWVFGALQATLEESYRALAV